MDNICADDPKFYQACGIDMDVFIDIKLKMKIPLFTGNAISSSKTPGEKL